MQDMVSGACKFWVVLLGRICMLQKIVATKKLIYLFILLATAGEIAVTAIYTTGIGGRIDGLTYGRYNEQILPILMGLGCIGLWKADIL